MTWEHAICAPSEQLAYFSVGGPTGHEPEDRLTVSLEDSWFRACIADGHWGPEAAQRTVDFWSQQAQPTSRRQAVKKANSLEAQLFRAYGYPGMNADTDRPPEAAFAAIKVADGLLSVTSYGDCRLLVANQGQITYELPTQPTWLGPFSYLRLRHRQSPQRALVFKHMPLLPGDCVALFTDGLDEWNHDEQPCISSEEIATHMDDGSAREIVRSLGNLAFSHNAQDDVSLLVYQA
jgi:serine/threonine protein phosphatase PrpC